MPSGIVKPSSNLALDTKYVVVCLSLTAAYIGAAKVGLLLAFLNPSATPVWPPTGIAFAAFLLLGYRVWPAILIGALFANLTTAGSAITSIAIAAGNTAEGLIGAWLVNRFAGGPNVFTKPESIFRFVLLAGMLSTAVSATVGVTSLALAGFAAWADYGAIWLTWWLGDAVGNLVIAPIFVLASRTENRSRWPLRRVIESALLGTGLVVVGSMVVSRPLKFLCIPFLIWAAVRFGRLEAALAVLVLAGATIASTLYGPQIVGMSPNETLLMNQAFIGVIGVMTMMVAAVSAERKSEHDAASEKRGEELRQSEERFRLLVERAHEYAIFMLDPKGRVITWNTGAERLQGYPAEEIIGQHFSRFYPGEDIERGKPEIELRAASQEGRVEDEDWRIRKDGSRFWANVVITALNDTEGRLIGFSKIMRDITERKQENEALLLLANVISSVNSAEDIDSGLSRCLEQISTLRKWQAAQAWVVDKRENVLVCLPGAFYAEIDYASFRILSLRTKFPKGIGLPGRVWENSAPVWIVDVTNDTNFPRGRVAAEMGLKSAFGFALRDGQNVFGVLEFFTSDSRDPDIHFLAAIDKLGSRLGEVFGRKQAEQALRASEEQFRAVAETANDAIISGDQRGIIIHWNKVAERIFGYAASEALGSPLTLIMPARFQSAHERGMQRYLTTGESRVIGKTVELSGRRKDGTEFPLELSLAKWSTSEGIHFTGIIRDITERKRMETDLARQAAELARSNADLEQFAYVASHDLQEPLRMVITFVGMLGKQYKGKLDAEADELIAYAVGGADRMRQLISDLLAYSRLSASRDETLVTDCEEVLQEVLENLLTLIQNNSAVITHDRLPSLRVDRTQMVQLLQNLLTNAIKFRGSEPPRVHLSAKRMETDCVFSVQDNGIGIGAEHVNRIFLVFERLHDRTQYPGTGIGLAICKKIVERHGGRIWVESQPGAGSTFFFTLPAHTLEYSDQVASRGLETRIDSTHT
ncbi:MAG TPA: PAS domain S-box protein [Pyrinomonadaceae bacterium]|nr:PAS domain S-box protein [Pyrinomonadaceae bacterium]